MYATSGAWPRKPAILSLSLRSSESNMRRSLKLSTSCCMKPLGACRSRPPASFALHFGEPRGAHLVALERHRLHALARCGPAAGPAAAMVSTVANAAMAASAMTRSCGFMHHLDEVHHGDTASVSPLSERLST